MQSRGVAEGKAAAVIDGSDWSSQVVANDVIPPGLLLLLRKTGQHCLEIRQDSRFSDLLDSGDFLTPTLLRP